MPLFHYTLAVTPGTSARTNPTYASAGVDIAAGDQVVKLIEPMLRRTYGPRVMGRHGDFAGLFRLDYNEKLFRKNYRDPVLVACTDGVGTKVKVAAAMGVYDTIGIDCVAMNVNDLIVKGAEPLFFLDYLGLHRNTPEVTAKIVEGVSRGCETAGCALLGGECAEMPDVYAEGDFDLAGFAVGVVPLKRAIDPMRVVAGDVIVGLASSGVHSNGYTLVRAIVEQAGLELDGVYRDLGDRPLGEVLLEPTRIYTRSIVKLLARYKVKRVVSGMAHITGGGLPGNIQRVLPSDVSARIETRSWGAHPIFAFLRRHGGVDRREMFKTFNMGVGFVLIVRPAFAASVIRQLNQSGEEAFVIGEVTKGGGGVKLVH